jgi:protein O-mannosyl-transferase
MSTASRSRQPNKKWSAGFQVEKLTWLPLMVLEIITAAFYWPSLRYQFQFDDVAHITKHFAIRHDNPLLRWWYNRRWFGDSLNALNFKMGGFEPLVYRITNVFIHMACGALVYYLVLTLCKNIERSIVQRYSNFIAFSTAGLFLLHPLQTQAVSYVIQARIEGVASFFILLNLVLFVRYVKAKTSGMRVTLLGLLALSTLLSCGTKEIFVLTPILMVLIDFIALSRGSVRTMLQERGYFYFCYGLFFAALVGWYIFDFRLFPQAGKAAGFQTGIGEYLHNTNNLGNVLTLDSNQKITSMSFFISQFRAVMHYLGLVFWPFSMSVEYDWKLAPSFMTAGVLIPLAQILVLMAAAVYSIMKRQLLLVGMGVVWFFIVLAPRSSFIPSAELVCDYKSYLAMVGIYMALAVLAAGSLELLSKSFEWLKLHVNSWQVYAATMVFVFLPMGTSTLFRNYVWSSNVLFWEDCIKKAPKKARTHNNYAVALCEAGKYEQAIKHYEKAIELDRYYQDPLSNLAVACSMTGQVDRAVEALKAAITLCPKYPEAYNNLGSVYIDQKKYDEAEKTLRAAIELRSYYGKAYFNLARICEARGDYKGVFENLKKATAGDLDSVADAHFKLGQAAFRLEKFSDAVQAFAQVVKIEPNSPIALFNYANALHLNKQFSDAAVLYERLVQLDPKDYRYVNNLAESHFTLNQFDKALPLFEKLMTFEQYPAQVIFRIAGCHEQLKRDDKAREFLAKISLEGTPEAFSKSVKQELARLDLQIKASKNGGVSLRDIASFSALASNASVKVEDKKLA